MQQNTALVYCNLSSRWSFKFANYLCRLCGWNHNLKYIFHVKSWGAPQCVQFSGHGLGHKVQDYCGAWVKHLGWHNVKRNQGLCLKWFLLPVPYPGPLANKVYSTKWRERKRFQGLRQWAFPWNTCTFVLLYPGSLPLLSATRGRGMLGKPTCDRAHLGDKKKNK